MIVKTYGDIFESDNQIILNHVTCHGMNGRFNKEVHKRYPEVKKNYKRYMKEIMYPEYRLGALQFVNISPTRTIANIFGLSEGTYKPKSDLTHLKHSLETLRMVCDKHNYSIAIPYGLGCDDSFNNWNRVEDIINEVFLTYPNKVSIYKNKI